MNEQDQNHLQHEQILWAVIDARELAPDVHRHLRKCTVCKARAEQLEYELQDLGRKAHEAAPPFRRTVKIPNQKPVPISPNAGWLSFFGAAAMAGFVVFFYLMGLPSTIPTEQTYTPQGQEKLLVDESLMREISEMVENPLFDDMYEITGEDGNGFDDDFLQFVVPDIQDDFQSELLNEGGLLRC